MHRKIRSSLPQFLRYLLSGGSAAAMELGSFQLMLFAEIWYVAATWLSAAVGLLSAFTFHKYFVFRRRERTGRQAVRFAVLQAWNAIAQTGLVIVFVEFGGIPPFLAKVLGIGCTVTWNFFLYKFVVYV